MKPPDKGLPLSSRVDFTIPSPFAREHLYYLIQYGRYQCVPGYEVKRIFWICTCARMYAAVRCTPSAESRARMLLPDSLYSWTAAFPTGTASRIAEHFQRSKHLPILPSQPIGFRPLWFHFSGRQAAASTVQAISRVFRSREKMTPSKFLSMNF